MSEPLKPLPLYELVREWEGRIEEGSIEAQECMYSLARRLRAWDEQLKAMTPEDDYWPPRTISERVLGVPPKEQA